MVAGEFGLIEKFFDRPSGRPDVILVDQDERTTRAMGHADIVAALSEYAPRETVGEITLWMRKP